MLLLGYILFSLLIGAGIAAAEEDAHGEGPWWNWPILSICWPFALGMYLYQHVDMDGGDDELDEEMEENPEDD